MKLVEFVDIVSDCGRRDLTINSMAIEIFDDMETRIVEIIDPYNGQEDLKNKVLRHATDAFMEDPVRVLRLARFRARLGADWKIAPETKIAIAKMAKAGVLDELTPERIWKELSRALMEPNPRLFFDSLLECDALHKLFPEVYNLKTALESMRWHPEGNAYEHTMLVLTQAALFNFPLDIRYAALTHDFGKALTPRDKLPSHFGHDVKGVAIVTSFSDRLTVPTKIKVLAEYSCRYHMYCHKLDELKAKTFAKMFADMGSLNNPRTVEVLLAVGICDERGRLGSENNDYDQLYVLENKFDAYRNVKFADVFPDGEKLADKIKTKMTDARIKAIASAN